MDTAEKIERFDWLDWDGARVKVGKLACVLEVDSGYNAYTGVDYMRVYATPVNKRSSAYLSDKLALGDDWSFDVLGSFETMCEVCEQLQERL